MAWGVFCTFDLKGATSADYEHAYADLEQLGLSRIVVGTAKEVVIPTTSVTGKFDGATANAVRDYVRDLVKDAFKSRGFKSEIFVFVGGNSTWGSTTT